MTWRNFGWDVNYQTDDDEEDDRLPVAAMVFDRGQYEAELRRFIETFDEVRDSLPARLDPNTRHQVRGAPGRRRWWPFT